MKAIGADVVLIDPQFAPKVIVKPEIEDMVDLISTAAEQENVDLFHRFALMRHWHEVNDMPFETFVSTDGLHMNDWSYSCIGKALADAITDAVTRPPSVTVSLSAGPSARGMPGYLSHWQLLTQLKSCAGSGSATERSSLASLLAFSASLRSPGAVVHKVGSVIV
jgi:hypothetical protein